MTKIQRPQLESAAPESDEEGDDRVIGRALRWSLVALVLLVVAGGAAAWWMNRPEPLPPTSQTELALPKERVKPQIEIPNVPFSDITRDAGITFVHENGAAGMKLLPETMGGGCAFFDFDGDSDQDILFVNSMHWPWDKAESEAPATMALYRNDGMGKFEDVTAGSGLDVSLYGMGAAVGDYDNDGRVDVFLSAVGINRLLHNEGEGKFKDVTSEAGVGGSEDAWSTSSSWFDYDNDGDLDLYVCNYLQWSRDIDEKLGCSITGSIRAYCRPDAFGGTYPYLYRNDGAGRFTDVSEAAGVQVKNPATGVPMAKALGLAPRDFDGDGWIDLVIANDTVQNFLLHNQQDGTFKEVGAQVGVAFDPSGNARGAMGIDSAHFRNDDAIGVAIGNFANEMTALYVTHGNELQFTDDAISTGLGPPTRLELKFGVFFFDFDLDGRLDLLSANGHLENEISKVQASQRYEQPAHLFWNCGQGQGAEFLKVPPEKCGPELYKPMVGRGAAYADIDGDGDLDVLLTASGAAPRLLRNDNALDRNWLRLKLVGSKSNRDAIGAIVEVRGGGRVQRRQVMPTRSYLSQCELPVTFGLGDSEKIESVSIRWPDGSNQKLDSVELNQMHTIEQPK